MYIFQFDINAPPYRVLKALATIMCFDSATDLPVPVTVDFPCDTKSCNLC